MKIITNLIILLLLLVNFSCKTTTEKPEENSALTSKVELLNFKELKNAVLAEGKLLRIDSFPTTFIKPRTVDVWLPKNYSENKDYAVLYMNDGQNLFDSTTTWNKQEWKVDETLSRLMNQDSIQNTIVVGIHSISEVRHSDYFPQKPLENLSQVERDSVILKARQNNVSKAEVISNSDNYLKFLVEDLKPQIDAQFSTKSNAENTVIAGSSMGGLISWYAVTEYPKVFGNAICISTHWPGAMPYEGNALPKAYFEYLSENLPSPKTHKFYFDFGDKTLDALYPPFKKQVDKVFKNAGYDEDNFKNLLFTGTDHSEASWQQRFQIPAKFILQN